MELAQVSESSANARRQGDGRLDSTPGPERSRAAISGGIALRPAGTGDDFRQRCQGSIPAEAVNDEAARSLTHRTAS